MVFAVPTYFFIVDDVPDGRRRRSCGTCSGTLGAGRRPAAARDDERSQAVTLFLLLHAFSSGTTALTGVEAISNGIPAFKEPRSRNAGITLLWMSAILGTLFLAISYLAGADRRRALGARDRDLAARAHGVRRARAALPRGRSAPRR